MPLFCLPTMSIMKQLPLHVWLGLVLFVCLCCSGSTEVGADCTWHCLSHPPRAGQQQPAPVQQPQQPHQGMSSPLSEAHAEGQPGPGTAVSGTGSGVHGRHELVPAGLPIDGAYVAVVAVTGDEAHASTPDSNTGLEVSGQSGIRAASAAGALHDRGRYVRGVCMCV